MIAAFTIPGIPVPKGRPRISVRGGFARAYTPEKTVSFENRVGHAGHEAMYGRPPVEGPLTLIVGVVLPIPVSWSGKKTASALSGAIRPCGRPDVDNFAKAVLDGLNGIVWRDDAQVVSLTATKAYGRTPCVEVQVSTA